MAAPASCAASGPVVTLKRLPYPGTPLTVGSSGETVLYYNLLLQRIAYYFASVEVPPLADRYTEETATATRSAQAAIRAGADRHCRCRHMDGGGGAEFAAGRSCPEPR